MKNLHTKIASFLIIGATVGFGPQLVLAQYTSGGPNLGTWTSGFGGWLGSLRYIITVLAILFVMINGIRFMMADGDKRSEERSRFGWSLLALFLILGILGIVSFFSSTTGIGIGGELQNELVPGVAPFPG